MLINHRLTHNLKVVGSNPTPATKPYLICTHSRRYRNILCRKFCWKNFVLDALSVKMLRLKCNRTFSKNCCLRRIEFIQARMHYSSSRHGLRIFCMSIDQYNQYQQLDRSRNGQMCTHFISRPNRSLILGIGSRPIQKMRRGLGSCKIMVILSFMDPMAIFRQIKAALILGTGDADYIIHGIDMKQRKYMRLSVVLAILKVKVQKMSY